MKMNIEIKKIVDKLTATYLSLGTQPSDLADAVFEPAYGDMQISKDAEFVYMTVSFTEDDGGKHKMRYTYTLDRKLVRVEQMVGRKGFKVQWDREDNMRSILKDLSLALNKNNESREQSLALLKKHLPSRLVETALSGLKSLV